MSKQKRTPADIAADRLRTGRPRLKNPRSVRIMARFTKAETAAVRRKARLAGRVLSEFIRSRLLED
jgi:hypothetical protein